MSTDRFSSCAVRFYIKFRTIRKYVTKSGNIDLTANNEDDIQKLVLLSEHLYKAIVAGKITGPVNRLGNTEIKMLLKLPHLLLVLQGEVGHGVTVLASMVPAVVVQADMEKH